MVNAGRDGVDPWGEKNQGQGDSATGRSAGVSAGSVDGLAGQPARVG